MNESSAAHGNLKRLLWIRMARSFLAVIPVVVLLFQQDGLSLAQVFLLQAWFALQVILLEVPSGYLSDRWGRRQVLILGCFLGFLGDLFMLLAYDFWSYFFAESFLALGVSLISGTDVALYYESYQAWEEKCKSFVEMSGKFMASSQYSEAIASAIGGFIAAWFASYEAPLYLQVSVSFLALIFSYQIKPLSSSKSDKVQSQKTIEFLNRRLTLLLLFLGFVNSATLCAAWFTQPFFVELELPLFWFGVVWSSLHLFGGWASSFSHRLDARYSSSFLIHSAYFLCGAGFLLMGLANHISFLLVLFLFQWVRGIVNPILLDAINTGLGDAYRATVLSLQSLISRLGFGITGPLAGFAADLYGLQTAFFGLAALEVLKGVLFLLVFRIFSVSLELEKDGHKPL